MQLVAKRSGVALLISEKIGPQVKNCYKAKHYRLIEGSVHQEDIIIINIYAPNNRAPNYMKQTCGIEGRNTQFYKNSWSFQYHNFNKGWNI